MSLIGYSKDVPEIFGKKNGDVLFRFNLSSIQVTSEDGIAETHYEFEQISFPPPADRSIAGVKAILKQVAAEKRWEREVGGLDWTDSQGNTWRVQTDRESQSKCIAAYVAARDGLRQISGWKMADGRYPIVDNTDIVSLALTVLAHVQGAYDMEAHLVEAIDACDSVDELTRLAIQV